MWTKVNWAMHTFPITPEPTNHVQGHKFENYVRVLINPIPNRKDLRYICSIVACFRPILLWIICSIHPISHGSLHTKLCHLHIDMPKEQVVQFPMSVESSKWYRAWHYEDDLIPANLFSLSIFKLILLPSIGLLHLIN